MKATAVQHRVAFDGGEGFLNLMEYHKVIKRETADFGGKCDFFVSSSLVLARGCSVDGDVRRGLVGGRGVKGRPRVAAAGVGVGVRGAAYHLEDDVENARYIAYRETRANERKIIVILY